MLYLNLKKNNNTQNKNLGETQKIDQEHVISDGYVQEIWIWHNYTHFVSFLDAWSKVWSKSFYKKKQKKTLNTCPSYPFLFFNSNQRVSNDKDIVLLKQYTSINTHKWNFRNRSSWCQRYNLIHQSHASSHTQCRKQKILISDLLLSYN